MTQDYIIKNKDCMDFLKNIESNSVDLVIVDPPYFEITKEEWDRQWSGESDYLSWCEDWTRECFRVLKPGRCFYVFGTTKTNTLLKYKLDVLDEIDGFHYNNWLIWHYEYGGKSRKSFSRKHEDCLMYSKGDKFIFNAEDVRIPYVNKKNPQNKPGGKIPTDVWFSNKAMSGEDRIIHPPQKPLKVLRRMIKASSNKGDVVLDCFSGSGATVMAALQCGRKFLGCEKDKDYFQNSINRILKTAYLKQNQEK